jgi:predicted NACHT family NTPase
MATSGSRQEQGEFSMPRPQKFAQTLAWLAQQGAYYGCVAVSLIAAAATLEIGPYIDFLVAVGGNLVANLLERAARGEDIPEDEVRRILESPKQLAAIKMLLEERGALLTVLRDDIVAATQEMRAFRAESDSAYQQMRQQLDEILRYLQPQVGMSAGERQRVLEAYANQLLHSQHQRMSTGGLTAESARVADQIREPQLDDIFVEPHLAEAGSLRTAHEELTRLFETFSDEDIEPLTLDQTRRRLLRLQSDTWEQLRKGSGTRLASQALAGKQAVVILGDPGSGKSTLLRWTLIERARGILLGEDGPVPLYAAIGEYARVWERERDAGRALPLQVYLAQRTDSECAGMQEIVTYALSDRGQGLLLLLDGLDEVPRELRRAVVPRLQEFLQSFVSEARPTRMLVSSRFFGYEAAPITAPAVQLAVVPFDNEQIRAFARKWYLWLERHLHGSQANITLAEQNAAKFEQVVLARPQIADLARNPLLLTMIAVVIRQDKRLPERRVELYDQALEQLTTQWEYLRMAARGDTTLPFSIDYNEACQLWAPIARWMHEGGTGAVHEEDLKQRLRGRLEELDREETAQDWLTVRGDKCCLLQERGDKLFSFLHQTFQEYLAAMDIYQDSRFVDDLERYIVDPRWHEVLRLACGYLGVICRPPRRTEVTELIRRIKDQRSS